MAAAFGYAEEDGPYPDELELSDKIRRYGVQAVFGRPLSFMEIRNMELAEYIVAIVREKQAQENWATWADANKDKFALYSQAGAAWKGRSVDREVRG